MKRRILLAVLCCATISSTAPARAANPWHVEHHEDVSGAVVAPQELDLLVGPPARLLAGTAAELWTMWWLDDTGLTRLTLTWGPGTRLAATSPSLPDEEGSLWVLRCSDGRCLQLPATVDTLTGTANDGELHATIDGQPFHATCAGEARYFGLSGNWGYSDQVGPIGSGAYSWSLDDEDPDAMMDHVRYNDDGPEHVCIVDGLDPDWYFETIARRVDGREYAYWRPL